MVPVPCSNGSSSMGANLPPLFLDDFITPGSGTGTNLVPYCGPNLPGHSADDSTGASWYLNLPPPAPPLPSSISLLPNHSIPVPLIDTFITCPQSTSAVITLPTNSNLDPPICAIKPQDQISSKVESNSLNQSALMSSLSSTYNRL